MKNNNKHFIVLFLSAIVLSGTARTNLDYIAKTIYQAEKFKLIEPGKKDDDDGVKGKIIVTAGAGYNFARLNFALRYDLSEYFYDSRNGSSYSINPSPIGNVIVDYGIAERVTAGIAFGYQRTTVNWQRDQYNQAGTINSLPNETDTWTRIHLAVRGDYRIIAKKEFGLYTGLRIGYNSYTMTSTYTAHDPAYPTNLDVHFVPFTVQAHFGFSYWFMGMVGLNAEVGLGYGGPYVGAIGLTGKF